MQAIIILGIFGSVYAVVLGFTISLSQSAIQLKLERVDDVRRMFEDIEYAVNKGVVLVDKNAEATDTITDLSFAQPYVSWNLHQLAEDPWGNEYNIYSFREDRTIYADGGIDANVGTVADNNSIIAPVRIIALMSAGPDGVSETTAPASANAALLMEADSASDDIVFTFSTYDSMLSMWNEARTKVDKIGDVLVTDYGQQLRAFQPEIDQFYADNGVNLLEAGFTDEEMNNAWLESPVLTAMPGFPRMPYLYDVDVEEELTTLPGFVAGGVTMARKNLNSSADVGLAATADSEWTVNYTIEVNGIRNY